jgi:amino acid permease
MGIASLTLGVTGLIAWLDPFIGFPVCIAGIITGLVSILKSKEQRKRAIAGLVLCFIELILTIIVVIGFIIILESGWDWEIFRNSYY